MEESRVFQPGQWSCAASAFVFALTSADALASASALARRTPTPTQLPSSRMSAALAASDGASLVSAGNIARILRVVPTMFEGFIQAHRTTFLRSLLAIERGTFLGVGCILGMAGVGLLAYLRWGLVVPALDCFLDLEGAFVEYIGEALAAWLLSLGALFVTSDVLLGALAYIARRRACSRVLPRAKCR